MKIPVCWASRVHSEAPCRGFWDQGFLEHLFDGRLGRLPSYLDFEHLSAEDLIEKSPDGSIVVLPARWHKDDTDWVNELIRPLKWVLLILTGDEGAEFEASEIAHPNMRMWVQTPWPHQHTVLADRRIGDFWPQNCPDILREIGPVTKDMDWFFAGQVRDHKTRRSLKQVLTSIRNARPESGIFIETPEFGAGIEYKDYLEGLAKSKVAPAPSGFYTPDTFRFFEALEAGCIPVIENRSHYFDDYGYWDFLFGHTPCPVVKTWGSLPSTIDRLTQDWPRDANQIYGWWQTYKREVVSWLLTDLEMIQGSLGGQMTPDDLITVIVTSSPTPNNPSAEHLWQTLASIREYLVDAEIIVCFDGVRDEQQDLDAAYQEYLRAQLWRINFLESNMFPLVASTHLHQALLTRGALNLVRTPYILFVEHDTPLVNDIDFSSLIRPLESGEIDLVRFYHEAQIHDDHRHLMWNDEPQEIAGVPLLRTRQWSQRPHLARTDFYRRNLKEYFHDGSRTMIEDRLHSPAQDEPWERWKMAIYHPDGVIKRSTHLDARGEAPKFGMVF